MEEERLNITQMSDYSQRMLSVLLANIKGQDDAVEDLVDSFDLVNAGLHDKARPLYVALLLGPSGVGKTLVAEVLAEEWFGSRDAFTKIDCAEYSEGHKISALIGTSAGYVGFWNSNDPQYRGMEPMLSQRKIDRHDIGNRKEVKDFEKEIDAIQQQIGVIIVKLGDRSLSKEEIGRSKREREALLDKLDFLYYQKEHFCSEGNFRSIILFDEIEKASGALHNLLFGILDKAVCHLGNGMRTRFNNSIILMTANVGDKEIADLMKGKGIGFKSIADNSELDQNIYLAAKKAARDRFPAAFLGRLNRLSVFRPLSSETVKQIFEVELGRFQKETLAALKIILVIDDEVKDFIVGEAMDEREEGARLLKNKIDKYIREPLSRLINRGVIKKETVSTLHLKLERDGKEKIGFYKVKNHPLLGGPS